MRRVNDALLLSGSASFAALAAALQRWEPAAPSCLAEDASYTPNLVEYIFCSAAESEFRAAHAWGGLRRTRALPAAISSVYLLALLYGKRHMAARSPILLPYTRTVWNLAQAAFSLLMFSRVLPALVVRAWRSGPLDALCKAPTEGPSALWGVIFALSKAPELIDTVFLVAARKELSLLHVWHHSSVLPFACVQALLHTGPLALGVAMNSGVHFLMYAYFAITEWDWLTHASRRRLAMVVTGLQTAQMAVALAVALALRVRVRAGDVACHFDGAQAAIWVGVYASYLVLFVHFADKAYGLRQRLHLALQPLLLALPRGWALSTALAAASSASPRDNAPGSAAHTTPLARFEAAARVAPLLLGSLSAEQGLLLYGLYKQVTLGDAPPGWGAPEHACNGKACADREAHGSGGSDGRACGGADGAATNGASGSSASERRARLKAVAWAGRRGQAAHSCAAQYAALVEGWLAEAAAGRQQLAAQVQAEARQREASRSQRARAGCSKLPPLGGEGVAEAEFNGDGASCPRRTGSATGGGADGALFRLRILGTGSCLPEQIVTTAQIEARGGFAPGELARSHAHVNTRHRAAPSERQCDMAAKACRAAVRAAGLELADISCIINASGTQEQLVPDGGALLQQRLGLEGVAAFSVHATCLSFVVALETAAGLLARSDGRYGTILISSSEISSAVISPGCAATAQLFGDGAAAVVVGRSLAHESSAVHAMHFETHGSGCALTEFRVGTAYTYFPTRDPSLDWAQRRPGLREAELHERMHFRMDGEGMVKFALPLLAPFLERLQPGLSAGLGDIDWVVPHQASGKALRAFELFGWPEERILRTIGHMGNCIAASIPLTLHEGIANGIIKRGDRILLCGTSAGFSLGGVILTY